MARRELQLEGEEKAVSRSLQKKKAEESVHAGRRQRMREKYDEMGLNAFQPHEILELLLYNFVPRGDVNPLAHVLINTFGSFDLVIDAPYEELRKVPGVGENIARQICLLRDTYRYYRVSRTNRLVLDSTAKIGQYVIPRFLGLNTEKFMLVCLNDQFQVLTCKTLEEGGFHSVNIDNKKILETALAFQSSKVVLVHNHPNGNIYPSHEDLETTKSVSDVLAAVNITLLDHMIVAGESFLSLMEFGMVSHA